MAEKNRSDKDPEKTVDMPPYGSRNPDPITEDNWLREYFREDRTRAADATEETYRPAYHYGVESGTRYQGRSWDQVETDLRSRWDRSRGDSNLSWDQARGAVRNAFDRTIRLHEEHLKVNKEQVRAGEVDIRKEVHTEHKSVTVPVEREEVVIERRSVTGGATGGEIKAEEIRIPVKEEKVNVSKETVVKEEVNVGKRKVQDTKTVSDDVRVEELKVEEKGDAKVRREK